MFITLNYSPVSFSLIHESLMKASFSFFWFLGPHLWHMEVPRGLIRATAASLQHSHSNEGSELRLQPTPQIMAVLDP